MTGPLWRREWRGGVRSAVRQPWMVPVVFALIAVVCRLTGLEFPPGGAPPGVNYWPPSALLAIWGPQAFLVLAMVGIVSWRVVCDRGSQDLAVTPLSPREIALAKTLAPTALSIAVIMGLAWREALDAATEYEGMILWRLGLYTWYGATFGSHGFDPGPLGYLLLKLALALRTLLLALVIVTMTTWVSARCRRQGRAMLASLGMIYLSGSFVYAGEVSLWEMFGDLPPIMVERMNLFFALERAHDEVQPCVVREALIILGTRFLLPLLWLTYWWWWAAAKFEDLCLGERSMAG